MWYINDIPTLIQIDGKLIHGMFGGNFDLSTTTVTAVIRLYHQLDDDMYGSWSEKYYFAELQEIGDWSLIVNYKWWEFQE